MSDELDDLLSQPLQSVADDGFVSRTMQRIDRWEQRRNFIDLAVVAICAVMGFVLVPLPALGDLVARATPAIASSMPLGIALAAILLTLSFERLLRPA
jgi:hypothetical protein